MYVYIYGGGVGGYMRLDRVERGEAPGRRAEFIGRAESGAATAEPMGMLKVDMGMSSKNPPMSMPVRGGRVFEAHRLSYHSA